MRSLIAIALLAASTCASASNFVSLHQTPLRIALPSLGGSYLFENPAGFKAQYSPEGLSGCAIGYNKSDCAFPGGGSLALPEYTGYQLAYREWRFYVPAGAKSVMLSGYAPQRAIAGFVMRFGAVPDRQAELDGWEYQDAQANEHIDTSFARLVAGEEVVVVHDGGGTVRFIGGNVNAQRGVLAEGGWMYVRQVSGSPLYDIQGGIDVDMPKYKEAYGKIKWTSSANPDPVEGSSGGGTTPGTDPGTNPGTDPDPEPGTGGGNTFTLEPSATSISPGETVRLVAFPTTLVLKSCTGTDANGAAVTVTSGTTLGLPVATVVAPNSAKVKISCTSTNGKTATKELTVTGGAPGTGTGTNPGTNPGGGTGTNPGTNPGTGTGSGTAPTTSNTTQNTGTNSALGLSTTIKPATADVGKKVSIWVALEVRPFWATSPMFFILDKNGGLADLGTNGPSASNAMVVDAAFPAGGINVSVFSSNSLSVTPGQLGELKARVFGAYSIGGGELQLLPTPIYDCSSGTCAR